MAAERFRTRRASRGFTLIEVLIASVILAGSLAVLFPTVSATVLRMRGAALQQTALMRAQSLLAILEADAAQAPRQGRDSGMDWTVTLVPIGSPVRDLAAYRATVAVLPRTDLPPVTLTGVVLGPPLSP